MIQPEYKRAYYKLLLQGDLKGMVHLIFFLSLIIIFLLMTYKKHPQE